MLTEGYITIERKLLEWQWHDRPDMVSMFLHLLLKANWEDTAWHGMTIKRGQLVTSLSSLSLLTGLSIKRVRNCLIRLEECESIKCKTWANRFRIITICKYDSYQDKKIKRGKPKANKGQSEGNPGATIKEINKTIIKEKYIKEKDTSIETRKDGFVKDMEQFREKYDAETLNGFYRYWTEEDKDGRMRFEQEKFWNTASRLRRWNDKPLR